MSNISEQKCPACGGPMRFDPASGLLKCDYCGETQAISGQNTPPADAEQVEDTFTGFDFSEISGHTSQPDADALPIYNCLSCGAEVIAPPEQIALTCPYCGNNIVLTQQVSGSLRPDGVIPFRIESHSLPEAVNRFYRGKKLLPRRFFSESTMGQVTGVYVPFWVFSGKVSGRLSFTGERTSSRRQGDYRVIRTDHFRLVRDAVMDFADVPVDASGRIDDKLMDSLEPFDMKDQKTFDMAYLAGFTADRFDLSHDEVSDRASGRMKQTAYDLVQSSGTGGYLNVTPAGGSLRADMRAKYLLFPVYLFDIDHNGRSYHFAVNGQTGKVTGELPVDRSVSFLYFLKHAGITAGILFLLALLRYFLGV